MTIEEVNELREEIQERNKKAKRITADYQREMKEAWNRWEDSDEEDPSHPFAESVMMGGQR